MKPTSLRNHIVHLSAFLMLVGIAAFSATSRFGPSASVATAAGPTANPKPTPTLAKSATFSSSEASAFLKTYCISCHGGPKPKRNFTVEPLLSAQKFEENSIRWRDVLERLEARDMPPTKDKKVKRPSEDEFEKSSVWLRRELTKIGGPASHLTRRLNRLEYNNTIRDLLRVDYPAADEFPPDPGLEGFVNVAEVQNVPPMLLEKYADAAQQSVQRAMVSGSKPVTEDIHYYPIGLTHWRRQEKVKDSPVGLQKFIDNPKLQTNQRWVMWQGGTLRDGKGAHGYECVLIPGGEGFGRGVTLLVNAPLLGVRYKVKVKAYAEITRDAKGVAIPPVSPGIMGLYVNGRRHSQVDVAMGTEPKEYEFEFVANTEKTNLTFFSAAELNRTDRLKVPTLLFCEMELIGPIIESWPPPSHVAIFGPENRWSTDEILIHFIDRAFRRPAKPEEVATYRDLVNSEIKAGATRQDAIAVALQAVMVSPNFLFLVEASRPDKRLSDFELATRLSYFLWSSMPDAELFRLAGEGKLNQPAMIKAQVARMLKDPKADALVEGFAAQWLGVRRADDLMPTFGSWDRDLQFAIQDEPRECFRYIMRENLSLLTFLDADFTFLNQRLARHYGISGVEGSAFRKVALKPEDHRGGLLSEALTLSIGSPPKRTSPVSRGKFVVDTIFNRPPPNPPANVPKLDEKAVATPKSLRGQMAQHARDPQCAGCHEKIDYWGLALEGYDGIGALRKVASEDETAVLPDGRTLVGIDGIKQELLRRKSDFVRGLAEKMMLYSLGRTLTYDDKSQIAAIHDHVVASNYTFNSLIEAIVLSEAFQKR